MGLLRVAFVLALTCLLTSPAYACVVDVDCAVGSKCLKQPGQVYGICAGGMNPGNANDRQPVYSPTDPVGTFGDTCQFDVDCGAGSRCLKSMGQIYGVCIR